MSASPETHPSWPMATVLQQVTSQHQPHCHWQTLQQPKVWRLKLHPNQQHQLWTLLQPATQAWLALRHPLCIHLQPHFQPRLVLQHLYPLIPPASARQKARLNPQQAM